MQLAQLKYLLLLLGIGGMIRCSGQSDSSEICLTGKQFDFYAQAHVERQGLRTDTALLAEEVRDDDRIISILTKNLEDSELLYTNQKEITAVKEEDIKKLSLDNVKKDKKINRLKQLSLILSGAAVVLTAIVLLK